MQHGLVSSTSAMLQGWRGARPALTNPYMDFQVTVLTRRTVHTRTTVCRCLRRSGCCSRPGGTSSLQIRRRLLLADPEPPAFRPGGGGYQQTRRHLLPSDPEAVAASRPGHLLRAETAATLQTCFQNVLPKALHTRFRIDMAIHSKVVRDFETFLECMAISMRKRICNAFGSTFGA